MARSTSRLAGSIAVVLAAQSLAACGYNTIPTKQERAEAAWADVQSQYQRRADLIPNLVATVQGAAIQERTTLTQVTEARARATSVQVTPETLSDPAAFQAFQAAQGQLTSALSRLLVTVEAYPSCRPTRISSSSSPSSKAPRTGSPSRGATTMRPSATTTPRCAPSRR